MRYSPPPSALADSISSMYEIIHDAPVYDELERADRPQLRVMIAGSGTYHFANGNVAPASDLVLLCATSAPVRGIGTGPVHAIGAGLLPSAWVRIAGRAAEGRVDCAIDGDHQWGTAAAQLVAAVRAAPSTDERFALLAAFIDRLIGDSDPDHVRFAQIIDAWLADAAPRSIDALAAQIGVSVRQLERRVKRFYGLPPKTLARKYRALRAALAMARGDDLASAQLTDSFYDQSHLIREVKRFAGMTPQQIRTRQSYLMMEHALGRKSLEGRVSPLVSDA